MEKQTDPELWTILRLLRWAAFWFKSHHIENPRGSAEILLSHVLGVKRIDLYIHHDQPVSAQELARFKSLILRRKNYEPVAYIVGSKGFWTLELAVTPDVLIPRPETECLVETALCVLDEYDSGLPLKILDLGTGSGAIALALAVERPNDRFFASDRSLKAVQTARKNAENYRLDERVHFFCADWFDAVNAESRFDLIVSNPPYIRTSEIPFLQPEICRYEPIDALDGGADGLKCIRQIIASAHQYLNSGASLLLEIGHDQQEDIRKMVQVGGYYQHVVFKKDYSGLDRVAVITR